MAEAQTLPASAYYIGRVKRKLATGRYPTEPVACLCGDRSGSPVSMVDRYGIPHRMVFCPHCGLLYANPRMTQAAYDEFYNEEYRQIYDGDGEDCSDAKSFEQAVRLGGLLKAFLSEQFGADPQTVCELGCNAGGWLKAFSDGGGTCLGVDHGTARIAYGRAKGMPVLEGGVDLLESSGLKADLIIVNHVLEHLLDPIDTLTRLRALLTDRGLLYVGVPSLFTCPKDILFQQAHVTQFTARTLEYVMECCGFEDAYLDERIVSVWRKVDDLRDFDEVNTLEVRRIAKYLNGQTVPMPHVKTVNKFPRKMREANIVHALQSGRPNIHVRFNTHAGQSAVILCGGPSIDTHVETIKQVAASGAIILSIERMLPWCLAHNIVPEYVVAMDAHEDVIEAFTDIPDTCEYLVSTQCQPSVLARLADRSVYLFSTPQKDLQLTEICRSLDVEHATTLSAGGCVAICAMNLALYFGMRALHVFGFDCHVTQGGYANGIAGVGEQIGATDYHIDGSDRPYRTTLPYLSFAQDCIKNTELMKRLGYLDSITVYGDSLVHAIARDATLIQRR